MASTHTLTQDGFRRLNAHVVVRKAPHRTCGKQLARQRDAFHSVILAHVGLDCCQITANLANYQSECGL